ncbi:MAG TPA: hypothetical protein VMP08_20295, partial [Anaerolineae bacterium]|nr:hypothetical protein [Anaerolineae bacterium]
MSRKWKLIMIALLIGAAVLFGLGEQYPESPVLPIGVGLLGLGVIISGVDSIITREAIFQYEESTTTDTYTGFSAVVWGICFVLIGLAILGAGVVHGVGADKLVLNFLGQYPGLALIYGSIVAFTFAIPGIIGSHEQRQSRWAIFISIPGRFFWLFIMVVAIAVLALGVLALISP